MTQDRKMNLLKSKLYYICRNPIVSFKEIVRDAYNDFLAISGEVEYDHNLIFVAGQPKSGTSWLESLLDEIPGYIRLNGSILRNFKKGKLSHVHGISDEMLSCAPKNKYSYLKLHTHYKPEYIKLLDKYNIKPVVLIRDLRDMMLSRYHHIKADSTHWFHDEIKDLSFNEGFSKSLYAKDPETNMQIIKYYTYWQKGWINYIDSFPEKTLLIKYENMKKDLNSVLTKVLSFYDIYFDNQKIKEIIRKQEKKHITKNSLSKNLALPGRYKTTFRKGKTGNWKECFTEEHKNIFKKETGNILIKTGYEKNTNW